MRRPWGLPADLFTDWSLRELEACRQRVAVEAPHELRRHPEATRHVWLAAYAHLRGRAVTDTLVDLLIETVHHIGARAEHKVEQELLDDLKRVGGKQSLLFDLAGAAVEKPDGTVREVLFPVVGEQTLRDLVRESKATGPTYRTTLRATIRSSYRGHYRRAVLDLLAVLDFRSNNDVHRPVIRALDLIRRYAETRVRAYPVEEDVPQGRSRRHLAADEPARHRQGGRPAAGLHRPAPQLHGLRGARPRGSAATPAVVPQRPRHQRRTQAHERHPARRHLQGPALRPSALCHSGPAARGYRHRGQWHAQRP